MPENLAKPGIPPDPPRTHKKKRSRAEIKRALTKAAGIYTEAADILQVNRNTVAEYVKRDPELQAHLEQVEAAVDDMAEGNIKRALRENDVATSKWWAERRRRDKFSTRTEHSGPDGGPIVHRYAEGEIPDEQIETLSLADLAAIKRVGQLKREFREHRGKERVESGSGNPQAGM